MNASCCRPGSSGQRLFEHCHGLVGRQQLRGSGERSGTASYGSAASSSSAFQPGSQLMSLRAHVPAALTVANPVLQNAVEQRPPFLARPLGIATRQLQHRVLYDIQRIVVVAHGDPGDAESALLDADEKAIQRAHLIQSLFLHGGLRLAVARG